MGNVYISLSRNNARETTHLCEVQVKESMKKECNCSLKYFYYFQYFSRQAAFVKIQLNEQHNN